MGTTFPDCRHAEASGSHGLRRCTSPRLAGLKFVTPAQCAGCFCRDHPIDDDDRNLPVATTRAMACAHLGLAASKNSLPQASTAPANSSDELARADWHACSHPRWGQTTLANCQSCPDYLFPVVTPRMPVALVRRLLELPPRQQSDDWWRWDNVQVAQRSLIADSLTTTPPPPVNLQGRGIVVVGGGKYFVSAYVTIRVLRHLGCRLPIEMWHLSDEVDEELRSILQPLGVRCIDADEVIRRKPFRFLHGHWWKGWQLKSFALLNCSFQEVLLLDADSYPTRNPEFLFDWPQYRDQGAIFWPDLPTNSLMIPECAWEIFGVKPFDGLPTESGQLLINKKTCWRELHIAGLYNEQADFVYRILYGDKDTFPMAWRRIGRTHARCWPHSIFDSVAIRQFDDRGQTLFIHRVHDKFRLPDLKFQATPQRNRQNQFHPQFPLEAFCFRTVHELASLRLNSHWLNQV